MTSSDDDAEQWLQELLSSFRVRPSVLIPSSSARAASQPAESPAILAQAAPVATTAPMPVVPSVRPDLAARHQDALVFQDDAGPALAANTELVVATRRPRRADASEFVQYRLTSSVNAGKRLRHAIDFIERLTETPTVFKIGVTSNPADRWARKPYGYAYDLDRYQALTVLLELRTTEAAGMAEAALIERFKRTPGCRNEADGGEGLSCIQYSTQYVYVVHRHLPLPPHASR